MLGALGPVLFSSNKRIRRFRDKARMRDTNVSVDDLLYAYFPLPAPPCLTPRKCTPCLIPGGPLSPVINA